MFLCGRSSASSCRPNIVVRALRANCSRGRSTMRRGATVVEAYPVDKPERCADEAMWFGAKSMFDAAGFEELARRKATRPVVRLRIG